MFTGNSNDNQLPHSSVLMRTDNLPRGGQLPGAGGRPRGRRLQPLVPHPPGRARKFFRDDEVRNVVYRIHEKNSLKIRKQRYGAPQAPVMSGGKWAAGAAAASIALMAAPALERSKGAPPADAGGVPQLRAGEAPAATADIPAASTNAPRGPGG